MDGFPYSFENLFLTGFRKFIFNKLIFWGIERLDFHIRNVPQNVQKRIGFFVRDVE